jgi:amino acid transporter
VSYLSANIGFYAVLPMDVVNSSQTIALVQPEFTVLTLQDFGSVLFGSAGGNFFAICVAVSCFGAMNASIFTAARLIHCAGRDNYLPSTFGELHPRRMTPIKALMLHGALSSFLIIIGDFTWLIMFKGIVEWTWYFVPIPISQLESR